MKDDDIEILDLDEDVIYPQKDVLVDKKILSKKTKNNKTKINQAQVNELKEVALIKKKDKKLRWGEKLFLVLSILFILSCIGFYGYRTYYYYHLTHDIVKNITLKDKLTSLNNIAYQNDGLYEKNGYYYYKGVNVDNYVYYSGRLFRIIDINDGIRLIEEETLTNLVWSIDSNYDNSIIHKWLNNYLTTLKDYDIYLKKNKWCNEKIDITNYDCQTTIDDYVGLININDYLQAGGKNSYLNNETYYWTVNQDQDGSPLYINSEGSINNIYKKDDNYFSYGIRPVITMKEDVSIVSGTGSVSDPFIVEDLGNAILKDNSIGSYVKYNNRNYRILDIDSDGVSLILDSTLDVSKKYSDTLKYLNNEFIKEFDKTELVVSKYDINEYSLSNKYSLSNNKSKKNYITIPNIGDMFINEYNGYWLNNYSDSKLGLYYTIDENHMYFSDLSDNTNMIRPIIKVNIETVVSSGLGLKDNPLIIGEEGEEHEEEN